MSHYIVQRVEAVKRTARQLAWWDGVGRVGAVGVACVLVAAGLDAMLRWEDAGTRLLLTSLWLVPTGLVTHCWLLPVIRGSWSNLAVAQLIERRFPQLDGGLSSAVSFLTGSRVATPISDSESQLTQLPESQSRTSSEAMVRNVIAETSSLLEVTDLRATLDWPRLWKSLGWLALSLLVACACVVVGGHTTVRALSRVAVPWRSDPWPRWNQLQLVEPPTRLARGDVLRLVLIDKQNRLPSQVLAEFAYDGELGRSGRVDQIAMQRDGDKMVLRMNQLTESFRVRATGGDDQHMEWHRVEVVDPPQIVAGQITMAPPSYTGWMPRTLPEPLSSLRVLVGTTVVLQGQSDRPLRQVTLRVTTAGRAGSTTEASTALTNSDSSANSFTTAMVPASTTYSVPSPDQTWAPTESGTYAVHLTDADGAETVHADAWQLQVVRDEPPTIVLSEPEPEELVTPDAEIMLRGYIEDDLALDRIELVYVSSDRTDVGAVPELIWQTSAPPGSQPMPESLPGERVHRELAYRWPLRPLALSPGTILSIHVSAYDFRPQSSQTQPRRLLVVSHRDLLVRLGRRQSAVLSQLQQRLDQQRRVQRQVDDVATELQGTQAISKPGLDQLQNGVIGQREINTALATDGPLTRELRRILDSLQRNRSGDTELQHRVAETLRALDELSQQHLEPALATSSRTLQDLQEMQLAQESQQAPPTISRAITESLGQAKSQQELAVRGLEKLLDELASWDNYRRFSHQLTELVQEQSQLVSSTQQLLQDTLRSPGGSGGTGAATNEVSEGRQRALLRGTAERQMELARRVDRAALNLKQAAALLEESDSAAAQLIRDALEVAREDAIAGRMRQAGQQIGESQLGLATQQQQAAQDSLQAMADQLSRRRLSPQERVAALQEAAQRMRELRAEQNVVARELEQLSRHDLATQRRKLQLLAKRQTQVARDAGRLQRQLAHTRASTASSRMGQAERSASEASDATQQGNVDQAKRDVQQAERAMELAEQDLQQEERQARIELAQEQMVQLPQRLEALAAGQDGVLAEITRLEQIRVTQGNFTDGQRASVTAAAVVQMGVRDEAERITGSLTALPSFVFVLEQAQTQMTSVAHALGNHDTSDTARQPAQAAAKAIRAVLDAMQESPSGSEDPQEDLASGTDESQHRGDSGQSLDAHVAQLRLLRSIQLQINQETQEISAQSPTTISESLRGSTTAKLHELSQRQTKLAELASDLTKPPRETSPSAPITPEPTAEVTEGLDALDQELEQLLR